ncbi:glycosyltransferase family 9 protein [uncultured Campylobacter sp.]|uniref:glycosyltransferase family 9 protein n=1 Tax=uncultured Campylobacter sp. TaxID=218934 RepID=UPI0025DDCFE1|nr:glycosyltransferase family 9 protein [uncultured Campylobacter sp.]
MASAAVEAIAKHAAAFDAGNSTGKFEDLGERDFSFSSQNFGPVTQEIQIFTNSAENLSDKFDAEDSANLTANAQKNQNPQNFKKDARGPVKIVFFGSFAACELFKAHPNCERVIVDSSKKAKFRLWRLFWQARSLGKFDAAFSFRSSFASKILLFGAQAQQKFIFQKSNDSAHQVQKYLKFVKSALNLKRADDGLKLYFEPRKFDAPVLGLNPGASYGSAKRWYPAYFAQVALHFKDKFKIMIFGGAGERDMCEQIEQILRENGATCKNLAGKTSVRELCENIGGIWRSGGIFVTNDSGPMHIAAAYKTPTIALFGPTRFTQTCPWRNENARILHLNLECMPCMKRVCPLKTHACMKDLSPQAVIQTIEREFIKKREK